MPPEADMPPEAKVLLFAVKADFAPTTRLLTDEAELKRMIEVHLTSLLSNFTSGPKPAVTVQPIETTLKR